MATLTGTTIVMRDGTPVVLAAGDQLPEWAVGMVGNHLLDEPAEAKTEAPEGTPDDPSDDGSEGTTPEQTGDSEDEDPEPEDEPAEAKTSRRRR